MEPMSAAETEAMEKAAEKTDLKVAAENLGVARFISDDPFTMLKMQRYGISFNMDGIWSGNMYAGGAGAILPNKITSKHNMRYVPKMNGLEMVKRIREQLDRNGYKDVEMHVVGDVEGQNCLIIDDIIDTAGTLVKTVDALYENGAAAVYACASHAVLSGPAIDRIAASRLQELVVTDTIPLREAAQKLPKIKVLSIAGLLGAAIESIHMETSVSTLFS